MEKLTYYSLAIICCGVIISCSDNQKIKSLETKINKLSTSFDSLSRVYGDHAFSQLMKEFGETSRSAVISLDSEGYQYFRTDLDLILFVMVEKIEPYLDGYKVKLNIGNPHNIDFAGGEIELKWGDQTKTHKFTRNLKRGSWNFIDIILSPLDAKENKFVSMSMNLDQILLYK